LRGGGCILGAAVVIAELAGNRWCQRLTAPQTPPKRPGFGRRARGSLSDKLGDLAPSGTAAVPHGRG